MNASKSFPRYVSTRTIYFAQFHFFSKYEPIVVCIMSWLFQT